MKKDLSSILLSFLFVLAITLPTVLYFLVGDTGETSLNEKRSLSDFPVLSYQNQKLISELETWYNDHAPYRMSIISLEKEFRQSYSDIYRKKIFPFISKLFTPSWYNQQYKERISTDADFLAPLEDDKAVYGRDDWLFYNGQNNIDFFVRNNLLDNYSMNEWRSSCQKLGNLCESKGINLVIMLIPNKEQIYSEYVPSYYIAPNESRAERFADFMADSGVTYIYPKNALLNGKKLCDIYLKQDTHWNNVGAYIGLTELYKALNIPYLQIDSVELIQSSKNGGDLSNFCGYATNYNDYHVNYRPDIFLSSTYIYDSYFEEIVSQNPLVDKKLVMIRDSFGETIKDLLAKDFRETSIIGYNMLNTDECFNTIKSLSSGDVLLFLRVERNDYKMINDIERITNIFES